MATIITIHIAMNAAAAPSQVWLGILIHAIDIVEPPGIAIPPDMGPHQAIVAPALARNRRAQVPTKVRSRATSPRTSLA
jgi:hypothetical protein